MSGFAPVAILMGGLVEAILGQCFLLRKTQNDHYKLLIVTLNAAQKLHLRGQ